RQRLRSGRDIHEQEWVRIHIHIKSKKVDLEPNTVQLEVGVRDVPEPAGLAVRASLTSQARSHSTRPTLNELEVDFPSTTQIDLEPKTIQLEVDIKDARNMDKTHQKPSQPRHQVVLHEVKCKSIDRQGSTKNSSKTFNQKLYCLMNNQDRSFLNAVQRFV
ncbi:uncharacterized protein PGTG_20451, partial [Puccinia graminis f. sp. tritici CRL 75-36-700-3]